MALKIKGSQVERVNALVRRLCCNCVNGSCLLLDNGEAHPCVQLLSVSGIFCRYFRKAVLPADKRLYAQIIRYNELRERKMQNEKLSRRKNHRDRPRIR